MKNFTLYWPDLFNMHLTKDVGTIPFIMKKYFGFNSKIYTRVVDSEYPDLKKYLENLPIEHISSNDDIINMLKTSDVLMLIGLYNFNYPLIDNYKKFNPNGKIYLKLDMNFYWYNNISKNEAEINYLRKCDVVSCESKSLCQLMRYRWNINIQYIPNGYYNFANTPDYLAPYEEKENTILILGRVGAREKCNDMVLNAFKLCANSIATWNLTFVGPISQDFKPFIDSFLKENEDLKNRINFVGPIYDKKLIDTYYKRSKIFCLTSNCEGFPLVFPEAAHNGCYIISTFLDPACDITNNQEYGSMVPKGNYVYLAKELIKVCNNDEKLKYVCDNIQLYSRENFDWIKICEKLNNLIKES